MPSETDRPNAEDGKRTYRACLHCRQRKSRCHLDSNKPPCSRCLREQRECILAPSRRGGHRVRKSTILTQGHKSPSSGLTHSVLQTDQPANASNSWQPPDSVLQTFSKLNSTNRVANPQRNSHVERLSGSEQPPTGCPSPSAMATIDRTIAAASLQNPSDALNILAQVEDEIDSNSPRTIRNSIWQSPKDALLQGSQDHEMAYPLIRDGNLSVDVARRLIHRYKTRYHPYFPIAHRSVFVPANLTTVAKSEPHLLTAILMVASKDEAMHAQVHADCSAHMQRLLSTVICQGAGDIETVEALLILAEWVPQRLHSNASVGHGEEDRAAWMQVGCAIRLGYLQELDQACFRTESISSTEDVDRKRLAWAACYVSDRQISVRIGKGFWSRGPGPMTSNDFPSLRSQNNNLDDYALTFQAHLELTQLFSNAHDILYGTKSHRDQLYAGGQYVKYLDDFRGSIRIWHNTWGALSCSANLKSTLILSYEYLRLYVNAFAYQATLNRAVARQMQQVKGSKAQTQASLFSNVAATPDARFIYEALDAAKSILSTFNSFIEPSEFQAFPLKYYFYIIYSVVFLYKARATGAFGMSQNTALRRSIHETVDRLQRTSVCPNDLGHRYSRLLRLLWRKPPNQSNTTTQPHVPLDGQGTTSTNSTSASECQTWQANGQIGNPLNMFSWLDLEAVGQFATANNSITDCTLDVLDEDFGDNVDRFDIAQKPDMTGLEGFSFGDIVF